VQKKATKMTLSGGDHCKVLIDGQVVSADGAVFDLIEGQTEISFGLVEEGELDADDYVKLSASYSGTSGTGASNTIGINLKDDEKVTRLILGDQHPLLFSQTYDWDNPIITGTYPNWVGHWYSYSTGELLKIVLSKRVSVMYFRHSDSSK